MHIRLAIDGCSSLKPSTSISIAVQNRGSGLSSEAQERVPLEPPWLGGEKGLVGRVLEDGVTSREL